MTTKAANEARAQLEELLASQFRLIAVAGVERGARQAAEDQARYVANGIEILRLAKVADLSAVSLPKPEPVSVHTPVAFNVEAIAEAEARLIEIETAQRDYWLDHSRALRAEIELAKRMVAP